MVKYCQIETVVASERLQMNVTVIRAVHGALVNSAVQNIIAIVLWGTGRQ
jgi:hypothetical protein